MRCEKVRSLLITDRLDNELSSIQRKQVENHLFKCRSCASYAESVYQLSIKPLRDVTPVKVPGHIWERISSSVSKQEDVPITVLDRVKNGLARLLSFPKPALAFATVAVVLLMAVFVVRGPSSDQALLNIYLDEQIGFLYELNSNSSLDVGVPLEDLL